MSRPRSTRRIERRPLHRLLVRLAGWLVPRGRRAEWHREWEAELAHREGILGQWGRSDDEVRRDLARKARGAFFDAGWLRLHDLREGWGLDLRQVLRRLRRERIFAVSVVVLAALGIAANTVLFTVVHSVLLRPLPFPHPEALVRVWETSPEAPATPVRPSPGNFQYWREHAESFAGAAAWYVSSVTLRSDGPAETRTSAQVSNDFFELFGVPPLHGRTFTSEEVDRAVFDTSNTHRGTDPVVVLSHRLWSQRFASDPDLVGKEVQIDVRPWRVIGVMPPGFDVTGPEVDLWIPWSFAHPRPKDQRYVQVVARLAPGFTLDAAQARMDALAAEMGRRFPDSDRGWGVQLTPLLDEVVGGARTPLWTLFAAVLGVLLVASLNLTGLQLVRASARRRETAVCLSLGASRLRLLRQSALESLLLIGAAAALAAVLVRWAVAALWAAGPHFLPRFHEIQVDPPVVVFGAALTLITGLVLVLGPAVEGRLVDPRWGWHEALPTATAGPRRRLLKRGLVIAEVAVAVILLVGEGLMARSLFELHRVDPGFDPTGVLVLPILLDGHRYDGAGSQAYYEELERRLASVPRVVSVGSVTVLPTSEVGPDFDRPVWREGSPPPPGEETTADVRMATPSYFDTLAIQLRRGRPFEARDDLRGRRVVIVNERLAARLWPDSDPVGRRLVIDYSSSGTYPYEVVGVVGDVRFAGPRSQPRPELYLPHAQRPYYVMNVAVRVDGDPETAAPAIRTAVLDVDPDQPVHSIRPLSALVARTTARERLTALLLAAFSAVALLLAGVGVYGVLAYGVRLQAREIAIRQALGARAGALAGRVLGEAVGMVAAGILAGSAGAVLLTRLLGSLLYGVRPLDPPTLLGVAGTLLAVALLAGLLPARRATRSDAARVLQSG